MLTSQGFLTTQQATLYSIPEGLGQGTGITWIKKKRQKCALEPSYESLHPKKNTSYPNIGPFRMCSKTSIMTNEYCIMHNDRHNVKIYTETIGLTSIFNKKVKKIPVHSVRYGKPFSNNFNGQKSNLLSC